MRASVPPFTKPEHAYDAKRLYDETQVIAESQDRHDPLRELIADIGVALAMLGKVSKSAQYLLAVRDGQIKDHRRMCTPAETAYLASFSPNPHPMMSDALRSADAKLHGPESRL